MRFRLSNSITLTTLCMGIIFTLSCGSVVRGSIYFPNPTPYLPSIGHQELIKIPSQNRTAKGLYVRGGEELVVLIHGNGYSLVTEELVAKKFLSQGYSVLLVEYPGYGVSSDYEATEQNIYTDTQALLDYAQSSLGFSNQKIILHGRSLGAGVAMEMSKRGYGNRLILLTPFTSIVDMGSLTNPRWLAEWIVEDRYDNLTKAPDHSIPTLIVGARRDEVTPFWMSEKLHVALPNSELLILPRASHDGVYQGYSSEDWATIIDFLRRHEVESVTPRNPEVDEAVSLIFQGLF